MGRGPRSRFKENSELILETLHRNRRGIRFTELHNILKQKIGSKSTLSGLLKYLVNVEEIEKDELDGKYYLSKASLFTASFNLTSAISEEVQTYSNKGKDVKKMLESMSKWIGVLSLYCAIKEVKTRRSWVEIAQNFIGNDNYLPAYFKRHILNSEKTFEGLRTLWPSDLMNEAQTRRKIKELEALLSDIYPREIKMMNEILENPPTVWKEHLEKAPGKN